MIKSIEFVRLNIVTVDNGKYGLMPRIYGLWERARFACTLVKITIDSKLNII